MIAFERVLGIRFEETDRHTPRGRSLSFSLRTGSTNDCLDRPSRAPSLATVTGIHGLGAGPGFCVDESIRYEKKGPTSAHLSSTVPGPLAPLQGHRADVLSTLRGARVAVMCTAGLLLMHACGDDWQCASTLSSTNTGLRPLVETCSQAAKSPSPGFLCRNQSHFRATL